MEFRRWILGVAVAFFLTAPLYAMTEANVVIASQNIRIYFPQKYQSHHRYPFILALGDRRQGKMATSEIWRPLAESINYIVVCVSTDEKGKEIDRKTVVAIRDYLDRTYRVDASTSVVIGIGASGSTALESALFSPGKIRHVMAFYPSFNPEWETFVDKNMRIDDYKYSSIELITFEGDERRLSIKEGSEYLEKLGINTELVVYPKPQLGYPDDLPEMVSRICAKVAKNASKENKH